MESRIFIEIRDSVLVRSKNENVRDSVESRRLPMWLDYAAAASLASGFLETAVASTASGASAIYCW